MDNLAKRVAGRYLRKVSGDQYTEAKALGRSILNTTTALQKASLKDFVSKWHSIGMNLIRLGSTTPDWDPETWKEESQIIFDTIRDTIFSLHNEEKRTKMQGNMALLDVKAVGKMMRRFR